MLQTKASSARDEDAFPASVEVAVAVEDGMWPEYADPSYRMPSQIEVLEGGGQDEREQESGGINRVAIQIERFEGEKLYLGGFRHRSSGLLYHHALTQTPATHILKMKDFSTRRTRDTQTLEVRTVSVQVSLSPLLLPPLNRGICLICTSFTALSRVRHANGAHRRGSQPWEGSREGIAQVPDCGRGDGNSHPEIN